MKLLLLVLFVSFPVDDGAHALPEAVAGASAALVGEHVFLFGGRTQEGFSDRILRHDDDVATLPARLPSPRESVAVATPEGVFLFGGRGPQGYLDDVVHFDSASGHVQVLEARLPEPRLVTAAAFDARPLEAIGCPRGCIHLFGGENALGATDEILRFEPASQSIERLEGVLPSPCADARATAVKNAALIVGCRGGTRDACEHGVFLFDSVRQYAGFAASVVPLGVYDAAVAPAERGAWIVGGRRCDGDGLDDRVRRFDVGNGTLVEEGRLPTPLAAAAALNVDGRLVVYGGEDAHRPLDTVHEAREGRRQSPGGGLLAAAAVTVAAAATRRRRTPAHSDPTASST